MLRCTRCGRYYDTAARHANCPHAAFVELPGDGVPEPWLSFERPGSVSARSMSALDCGCDPGERHLCARHAREARAQRPQELRCPDCGGRMVGRTSEFGRFWGCSAYPQCAGTRDVEGRSREERGVKE